MDFSPASLLASLLYTWGLGLLPAFIARRVAQRPLEKFEANGLAFVTCATLAVLAVVLRAGAGEANGRVSPAWILVFLVSRWIMIRPDKGQISKETTGSDQPSDLSRDEITAKLRQIIADPAVSDQNRARARDQLEQFDRPSRKGGRKQPKPPNDETSAQQRLKLRGVARYATFAIIAAAVLNVGLLVSGYRFLLKEKLVHPGQSYMTDEWGDVGAIGKSVAVCWYWSGRKLKPLASLYGPGKNEIDECPLVTHADADVWTH